MGNLNGEGSPPLPATDSTANTTFADVIGSKLDAHDSDSIYAQVHAMLDHIHKPSNVYPTLANGVTITAGAAWVLGNFAEVVPVDTITSDFDIHYVSVEDLNANTVYELVLYAATVEIGRCRFTKNVNQDGTMKVPIQTAIQPANTQIQAKLATAAGSSTADISLFYHEY